MAMRTRDLASMLSLGMLCWDVPVSLVDVSLLLLTTKDLLDLRGTLLVMRARVDTFMLVSQLFYSGWPLLGFYGFERYLLMLLLARNPLPAPPAILMDRTLMLLDGMSAVSGRFGCCISL